MRFDDVKDAREKIRQEMSEEDEYNAEDEGNPKRPRRVRQLEARTGRKSPKEEAVKAAKAAAEARIQEFEQRRSGGSEEEEEEPEEADAVLLPTVPEDAADRLYALRQKSMLRQYLRDWHSTTIRTMSKRKHQNQQAIVFDRFTLMRQAFDTWQERAWFSKVERRAEDFYNQSLVSRAFSIWIQRTATIVQRTDEMRQRILARKYFNAWREIVLQNERNVRQFQLGRVWDRWLDNYRKRKEMEQKAVGYYNGYLAVRVYWTWYFALCGKLGSGKYDEKLIKRAFEGWIQRTETSLRLGHMADAFFRRKTLQTVFAHWAKRTEENIERQDLACDYSDWRLMQTSLNTWKRDALMAPRVRALQEYHDDRIAAELLLCWRERTKNSVAAEELCRQNSLKRALKRWRLVLRLRIVQENHDRLLQERMLANWARQERLQLLRRTNDRRLARKVIHDFAVNLRLKHQRLRIAYRDAALLRNRSLAHSALTCWIFKVDRIASMSRHAELRFEASTADRALTIWRAKTQTYTAYSAWAADSVWYFTAKRALATLKSAYLAHRKTRLKQTYHFLVRQRKRNLAARIMQIWRGKLAEIADLSHTAAHFDSSRQEDLAQAILAHWRERTSQIESDTERAEGFDARRLMRRGMGTLVNRHHTIQVMAQEAEILRQNATLKIMGTYVHRWDTQFWNLTMLYERGERLFARKEALRVKAILRSWRDQVRPQEEVEQLEGFSEAPVLLPPPMTQLRRRMDLAPATPGFKTAGRRRGLLGNAMSQTPLGSPGSPLKRFAALGLGQSRLGRVSEPVDEEEEGSYGSATATFVGSRSTMDRW